MHLNSVVWSADINKLDSILMHSKMEKNLNSICARCGFIEHMYRWTRDYWREANNLTFCQKLFTFGYNREQFKDTACSQQPSLVFQCIFLQFGIRYVERDNFFLMLSHQWLCETNWFLIRYIASHWGWIDFQANFQWILPHRRCGTCISFDAIYGTHIKIEFCV